MKTDNDETSKELETEPVDEAVEQEEVQIVVPESIVVAKAIEQETEETTNPKTDVDDTTVIQNEPVTETVEIATVAKDVKMATTATSKTVSVNEVNTQEETVSANEVITEESVSANEVEQDFSNLVIAQVNDYVNVREQATEQSEIIGKLYNKSVGTLIIEENGWYKIHSGNVEGYVKAEYCVTGEEAEALVDEVGEKIATVTTTTLKVRKEPGTEAEVLGLVPIEEELTVLEETDGWVKVSIEEGEGYVSSEYVSLRVDFVEAESKEEEEARLKKEEEERQAARVAANARLAEQAVASVATETAPVITSATGSAAGKAVVDYALQFVGNPYVYGGTSLTNGADCSGFVMSVYAHFGVALPHSSAADRHVGYDVGGLENAQPGDLVCYSGHVGIYAGNGQIVHASSSRTGIIVSRAGYRPVLAVRRIF
ncbi:MAG: SH3 domain-containing protein [Lachnospiraceae bacterium]|nr:SH3 domain-containing protein [Lachnospiraceae bacterium]